MWPALALGLRGASMALAIATGCAFAGGLLHTVGTASAMSGIAPMIMVQQFIAVSGSTVLLLAAVDTERRARNADRLRLALEAARQGVFEMDAATSDLRLDAQARRLLGAPMEPAVLRWNEFLALLDPDDRTLAGSEALRAASSDGSGVLSVDLRVRAPDGPLRWVAMYGRTSFDGAGPGARPVTTTGTVRDITERKQVVARIQEREVFVRQVLDNLPMFVGVLTPDGMLVEMNRAAVDAAGLELDDVIGRKLWECHWWSYSPALQNKLRQAMGRVLTGEVVRFDAQMRMSGSTLTWVDFQLAPLYDDEGRLTHAIPSAIDLTARKRAEEARQRLTSIIEATPDFVGIADPQGHTIYVSPGGRRLVGLSALEPVEGTLLADWHPPDVAEMISTSVLPTRPEAGCGKGRVHC